ncbi:MAG TPA: TOBE domain-containing protein, partial [Roseivirga sp.]
MNSIKAEIIALKTAGSLTLVELVTADIRLKSIVIDTPETVNYLVEGSKVNVVFKETEVSVATERLMSISLQNQISGVIESLTKGELLSRVELITELGIISAVITTDSVQRLNLKVGQKAYALIKTNELML